ncbi:MAG: FadR family transcriptional regulator [Chloracidobacterium sp.]|nr:FadR family transcriptional regulator [Chloracidobacterium sp.]
MIMKHMQPGMKLPAERQLADDLNVGRPAVREAIKALEVLDVIERRRGDGNYVKSLAGLGGGWATVDHIEARFDMLELLEVRKMIEPAAAALAAARRTNRQLREIEIELLAQEAQPDNHAVLERHDYLFHEAIIRAAGNQVLADTIRFLSTMLQKSRRITGRTTPDIPKIIKQHRTIYEAIRLGEMDLAQLAMKDHLQTVGLDMISERKR